MGGVAQGNIVAAFLTHIKRVISKRNHPFSENEANKRLFRGELCGGDNAFAEFPVQNPRHGVIDSADRHFSGFYGVQQRRIIRLPVGGLSLIHISTTLPI